MARKARTWVGTLNALLLNKRITKEEYIGIYRGEITLWNNFLIKYRSRGWGRIMHEDVINLRGRRVTDT